MSHSPKSRTIIFSSEAPAPVGPYSQGVATAGELVFLSGQLPMDPKTGEIVSDSVSAQSKQIFKNLEQVLAAADINFDHVVKVNVFLTDMADFAEMNAVYETVFSSDAPARSTVAVAALPLGARVEIELIASR